jgi:hypothetical protein
MGSVKHCQRRHIAMLPFLVRILGLSPSAHAAHVPA